MYPNYYNEQRIEQISNLRHKYKPKEKIINHFKKKKSTNVVNNPSHAYIETLGTCNYACISCPQGYISQRSSYLANLDGPSVMPLSSFKDWVDQFIEKGIRSIALYCTNEPLLDPLIFDRLDYLSSKDLDDVLFMSNGFLMNSNNRDRILSSCVTKMCFSIDAATTSTYEVVRPLANSSAYPVSSETSRFDFVVGNIRNFMTSARTQRPDMLTRVSFVVSKDNHTEIDQFKSMWQDYSDVVEFQYNHNANFMSSTIDSNFSPVQVETCNAPNTTIFVRPDGTVYPCCAIYSFIQDNQFDSDLRIGNLNLSTYNSILSSVERLSLIDSLNKDSYGPRCDKCLKSNYCHQSFIADNKFNSFSPVI